MMKKKKAIVFILFFCLILTSAIAQSEKDTLFFINAMQRFRTLQQIPVEKLYLHIDKPYYSAGENIWYSGYLVNAISLQPNALSKFIFVELINQSDSIIHRYKIREDSTHHFSANIPLAIDIPMGNYLIRAYTWWMQNAGKEYFFTQPIFIGNPIDQSIQSVISYQLQEEGNLLADISFQSIEQYTSFTKKYIDYKIFEGKKLIRSRTSQTDANGHLKISFDFLPDTNIQYQISIAFNDDKISYKKDFFIPIPNNTFDIQFFPEGGNLLNDGIRNIAFKTIGQNGFSVNVEGVIYNQQGDSITSISSTHQGMGVFQLPLLHSKPNNYTAKVHIPNTNKYKNVNLPPVLDTGFGISLQQIERKLIYNIFSAGVHTPSTTLYLLVHERGKLLFIFPIKDSSQYTGKIPLFQLPSGIVHFLLLDSIGNALSQRISFVYHPSKSNVWLETNKEKYATREKVDLSLSLSHDEDSLINAVCSISITEDETVKTDSNQNNIITHLLLTSDLKGYIETPNAYFNEQANMVSSKIDLVMLTHGWTRFNVPDILNSKFPKFRYFLEVGQSISGKITNVLGKGINTGTLITIGGKAKIFKLTTTDEHGNFLVEGISFPDSTTFILQGKNKRGYNTVDVLVDKDSFPILGKYPKIDTSIHAINIDNYLNVMNKKYQDEGVHKITHLKEITVYSQKSQTDEYDNPMYAGLGNPMKNNELEQRFSGQNILEVLRTFSGVNIVGNSISIRGSANNPLLVIDDMPYNDDDISNILATIDISQVGYLNVLKDAETSIFGAQGGNGVIIINFKKGIDFITSSSKPLGIAIINPLGYYKPNEFYNPKYENQEEKNNPFADIRTTIYWNPHILLNTQKPTNISFYTADRTSTYTMIIEGISHKGEPFRYTKKIKIY